MKAKETLLLCGIVVLSFLASTTNLNAQNKKKDASQDDIFLVVEEMPKFQNGDVKTFQKWVGEQVKYPKEALKGKISGKVFCEFVIGLDGTIGQVKITKSVHKLLDDEVMRVVKSSPGWTPGKQRGKEVLVKMSIPVVFKLS